MVCKEYPFFFIKKKSYRVTGYVLCTLISVGVLLKIGLTFKLFEILYTLTLYGIHFVFLQGSWTKEAEFFGLYCYGFIASFYAIFMQKLFLFSIF